MNFNNITNQQDNREKAQKYISDWIDCFLKADGKHKDLIGRDFMTILGIKAQGNPELNYRLSQGLDAFEALRMLGNQWNGE